MTVHDYVKVTDGQGTEDFGINGYYLAKTNALSKAHQQKIHNGKKTTYIDDAIRAKRGIPDFKYELSGNMLFGKERMSNLEKAKRNTPTVQIENWNKKNKRPTMVTYKPDFKQVEKDNKVCLNFKSPRHSVYSEAMWRG